MRLCQVVRPVFLVVLGLAMGGCAPPFPKPMIGLDLARFDPGKALVAYLGQTDASPAVCDLDAKPPYLTHFDQGVATSLVEGLVLGHVNPELWRRCTDTVLDGASPEEAAVLLDAVAGGYQAVIEDRDLETSLALQLRATTLQKAYVERPTGVDPHPSQLASIVDELRRKVESSRTGTVATRFARELLAIIDLEQGRYGGRPVDVGLLDDLARRRDEALLRRFADRLPSKALRDEARRRVVKLAVAASSYPEVRASPSEVEARVMDGGVNRISLAAHAVSRASLVLPAGHAHPVLVRQDVSHQLATLVDDHGPRAAPSVLPEVSLRLALRVEVAGLTRPITLCQRPRMLDPSPCIAPEDVNIANPIGYIDRQGSFHLRERISTREAVGLAQAGEALALPLSVGGRPVTSAKWPLRFERPDDIIFSSPSGTGPDLKVAIDHTDPHRFSFVIRGDGSEQRAVVEAADLPSFRIVSRGAPGNDGSTGSRGFDGTLGLDGSSASCPSTDGGGGDRGGDGSDGGPGGDGEPGRDGGNLEVEVDCGANVCASRDLDLLRRIVVSEGGRGGSGGRGGDGGRGGRGGSGGSGTSCHDDSGTDHWLSAGSDGMNGSDGHDGQTGRDGAPGRSGPVRFSGRPH